MKTFILDDFKVVDMDMLDDMLDDILNCKTDDELDKTLLEIEKELEPLQKNESLPKIPPFKELTFDFEFPGVKKEDIKINKDGKFLQIEAKRKEEIIKRSVVISDMFDIFATKAIYENGLLTIKVPKHASEKPFSVKID